MAWSPDARELVFAEDGFVRVYNLSLDATRVLAKGSHPLWSPQGDWISYRSPNGEAMLIDPSGKTSQAWLPGRKISHALHWSPDGRYLLLTLLDESGILPWAHMMIYRLSDQALTPIGKEGGDSLDDSDTEWVATGPRH